MKKQKTLLIFGCISALLCAACVLLAVQISRKPELPDFENTSEAVISKISETLTETTKYRSPVDFNKIQKDSPDVFSWIKIDGTDIDYPVAFREGDNSYYLRRNIYGNYDRNGTLFIEDYNNTDFNDPVTIIYGHHMSSGAMFGKLQQIYTNPETFKKHQKITVYTPEKTLKYLVFCAVPLDNSHILYYNNFNNKLEFEQFFSNVYNTRSLISIFDEAVKITHDDRILMLSTCFETDYSRRYVVMAVCEDDI